MFNLFYASRSYLIFFSYFVNEFRTIGGPLGGRILSNQFGPFFAFELSKSILDLPNLFGGVLDIL